MSRVVVALSGGVDSSVAAAILAEAGHEVIAVTLRMQRADASGDDAPPSKTHEGILRARRVAKHLGVPLHVLDVADAFEAHVLAPAWADYDAGRTPSPCVRCNPHLKIASLLTWAQTHDADTIATGHYARVEPDEEGRTLLRRATDRTKDQSYFLAGLTQTQLRRLSFPLGSLSKGEVRALARRFKLPTAETRESQDACFVAPGQPVAERLRARFAGSPRSGSIVDRDGAHLGQHEGIHRFTIGQRRGLNLQTLKRHWVLRIDGRSREVVVTSTPHDLDSRELRSHETTWILGAPPPNGSRCRVQVRSTHDAAPATLSLLGDGTVDVHFDEDVRAITPGQAAVFYDASTGDRVLGQGWIASPRP